MIRLTSRMLTTTVCAVMLSVFPNWVFADDSDGEEGPLDYGVCNQCQSDEFESLELSTYFEMIAGFRWQEEQITTGRVKVEDAQGQITMYRWTSDKGVVTDIEILSTKPGSKGVDH